MLKRNWHYKSQKKLQARQYVQNCFWQLGMCKTTSNLGEKNSNYFANKFFIFRDRNSKLKFRSTTKIVVRK